MSFDGGPEPTPARTTPPTAAWAPLLRRAWVPPLVGYAAALVMTLALLVLVAIAMLGDLSSDDLAGDDVDASTPTVVFLPLQLAALGLWGRLHIASDDLSVGIIALPLLITATFLVVEALVAGHAERRAPSPTPGQRAAVSAIAAGGFASVLTIALWALALRSDGTALHSASVSLFLGTLVLTFVADIAGRSRAAGVSLIRLPAPYAAAATTWLVQMVVWVAISLPVLFVTGWVSSGFAAAITVPIWAPSGSLYAYVLAHQGAVSGAGEHVWIWSSSPVLGILLLIAAALLAVFTAVVWHVRHRRTPDELAQPASWLPLPATYAAGGILIIVLTTVVTSGGMLGYSASITVHPALWSPFILALVGLGVELLSRTVAPSVVPVLPQRIVGRLRAGTVPAGSSATSELPPPSPEQVARNRKTLLRAGAGLGVAVVLVGGYQVVASTVFGPKGAVETYLDAVVEGDVEEVLDLTGDLDQDRASTALLTQEVYEAADARVQDYDIADVTSLGSLTMVEVELNGVGDEGSTSLSLEVERAGTRFGIFPRWQVAGEGLASAVSLDVPDGAEDITVDGVTVDADASNTDFWLLPATYEFDPFAGNQWVEPAPRAVVAKPSGSAFDRLELPELSDFEEPRPSQAFIDEVDAQVTAYLEECMSRGEIEPEGCPIDAYAYGDVRKVEWELISTPDLDLGYGFDGTFPVDLSFEDGEARVSYEDDQSYGYGPRDWQPQTEDVDIWIYDATAALDGDELVVTFG